MVSIEIAKQLALSLPEAEEKSHFEKPDFRVKNKVFAVLHNDKSTIIGWSNLLGIQTMINLKMVKRSMLLDALTTAWKTVAPSKLVAKYFP